MQLATGDRLGPYEILGPLGAGGMGEVYRARDGRLRRDVALKIVAEHAEGRPDRLRRFEQEARAVAALNDPNIRSVYDVGVEDGTVFVVFELLEGQTLRERLDAGALSPRKAIEYAVRLASGLAAAHSRGVVHRDLKPDNVFLTREGHLKILDFGLARFDEAAEDGAPEPAGASTRTQSGLVVGTAGYMSPEQARGTPADSRSDIFALGAVLYEMLAGRPAFGGASPADRLAAVLHRDPPELTAPVAPPVRRVLARCLEKDQAERFQSARDVAFALEAAEGASLSEAAAATSRRPWWIAVALLAGALALLAGVLGLKRPEPAAPPVIHQLTFGQGIVTGARFLPNDEHTVVYSASWSGRANEIYMTRSDGPESRSLGLPPAKLLGISSRSELAILLTRPDEVGDPFMGTLARVPLGGGVPRPVLDFVEDASWAPDGEELAVVRWVNGVRQLEYPVGNVLIRPLPAFGNTHSMRLSPRGDKIAIEMSGRLVVVDRSGTQQTLSGATPLQVGLAWTPAGDAVLATTGPTNATKALWRLGLDGSRRQVFGGPGVYVLHDVSASGTVLIHHGFERGFVRGKGPGDAVEREIVTAGGGAVDISRDGRQVLIVSDHDLSLFSTADASSRLLLRTQGQAPDYGPARLSPDGRFVVDGVVDKNNNARLAPIGPGDPRRLPLGHLTDVVASFLDDGRLLWHARETPGGPYRGFVQDVATGAMRPVTPPGIQPLWSPEVDGAVLGLRSDGTIVWCPLAGGEPRPTRARFPPNGFPLQTTRDGRYTFVNVAGFPMNIDRIDLRTGERTAWRKLGPPDVTGLAFMDPWVPMTFDGEAYAYSYLRAFQDLFLVEGLR